MALVGVRRDRPRGALASARALVGGRRGRSVHLREAGGVSYRRCSSCNAGEIVSDERGTYCDECGVEPGEATLSWERLGDRDALDRVPRQTPLAAVRLPSPRRAQGGRQGDNARRPRGTRYKGRARRETQRRLDRLRGLGCDRHQATATRGRGRPRAGDRDQGLDSTAA